METKEAMILRDRFDERAQRERLVKAQRFIGIWRLMAVQVNIKKLIDSKIIDEAMAEVRKRQKAAKKRGRESLVTSLEMLSFDSCWSLQPQSILYIK